MYYSLYKPVSDPQPIIMEDVEFTFHLILEIDEIKDFGKMQFEVPRSPYQSSDAKKFINENNVIHQLIDKIQFPPILLPSKPNALSPQQSFDIVRHYIKQHINLDFAEITSDYDFCFTAAKKIAYTKKEAYTVDVNNSWLFQKRKRKPKYKTRYRSHRTVTCFSMAPKPYQSYSVIDGFRGKDQEDLENNIADYCKQVIDYINAPLVDCPHCEGKGVVFTGALDCNSIKEKL